MVNIKEFAQICHTTVKTIRFYDNCGLLKADYVSQENGYRYYHISSASQYYKIVVLKQAGFSLKEIREQLYCLDMEQVLRLLDDRISLLTQQLELCTTLRKGVVESMEEANKYQINVSREDANIQISTEGASVCVSLGPKVREHLSECMEMIRGLLCQKTDEHAISISFEDFACFFDNNVIGAWQSYYIRKQEDAARSEIQLDHIFQQSSCAVISLNCSPDVTLFAVEHPQALK